MKKTTFSTLFLFFAIAAFCQENKPISFGFEINPKITHQLFNDKELADSKNLFGLNIGGNVFLNTGLGYEFKAGLQFSKISVEQKDYSFRFGCQNNGQGGIEEDAWVNSEYSMYYIGVPITHRFNMSSKPNRLYMELGTEIWLLLRKRGKEWIQECGGNEPIQTILYTPASYLVNINLGFGYEFSIKEKYKIYIGPKLEGTLTKVFKKIGGSRDILNNSNLVGVGLNMGVRF